MPFFPFAKVGDLVDRHCLEKLDHRQQELRRAFQVRESATRRHPEPAASEGAGKSFVTLITISLELAMSGSSRPGQLKSVFDMFPATASYENCWKTEAEQLKPIISFFRILNLPSALH